MRKFILSWLLNGDVVSWKEMFKIAIECNENNKETLKRMEHLFKLYKKTAEKQIATLEAIKEFGDVELKKKIAEIYKED